MKVIEVVQFDTQMVEGKNYEDLSKTLHTDGYGPRMRDVNGDLKPTIGFCWYIAGEDGNTKLYKSNYDTSD